MSYTLKSTGLATSCITAIVVDDDGTTVRDIATGQAATLEVDAANGSVTPTIADGTWNALTRKYVSIPGSANAALDFGLDNLNLWQASTVSADQITIVALVDDYANSPDADRPRLVGSGTGSFYIGKGQWGSGTFSVSANNGSYEVLDLSATDRMALCLVIKQGQQGPAYISVDGANVGSNVVTTGTFGSISFIPRYIGRDSWSNKSGMGAKLYGLFVFDGELDTSTLNTFVANPWGEIFETGASAPTILDAGDEVYQSGETGIVITGTGFGATQGAGSVVISPTDNVNDAGAVTQTVTAWSDTSVTITANRGSLSFATNLYLFVKENGGQSNAAGYVVQFEPVVTVTETLVDMNGDPVASETGLTVFVWAADPASGANPTSPDTALYAESTDANGVMTFGLSGLGLSSGDPVWVAVMKDGSPYRATLRKITPTYS